MQLRRWFLTLGLLFTAGCEQDCKENGGGSCCRTCTNSKACGDSCIPLDQTCHAGAGCACNGETPDAL